MGLPGGGWLRERRVLHSSHGSVGVSRSSSFGYMACGRVWGGILPRHMPQGFCISG